MRPLAYLTMALAFMVCGRTAEAQSDAVPRELVDAILRAIGGPPGINPVLLVGRAPDSFAPRLDLRGGRILGSITVDPASIVVIASRTSPDSTVVDLTRQFRALGWEASKSTPASGPGFQEAGSAVPGTFCRGDTTVSLRALARPAGGSEVTLLSVHAPALAVGSINGAVVQTGPGGGCGSALFDTSSLPEMPTLYDPPANGPIEMCYRPGGGFASSNGTSTTLRTSLSADAILAHYAKQLQAAGWVAAPAAKPAILSWIRPDSAGFSRETTLSVKTDAAPGCYTVSMEVKRRASR